VAAYVLQKLAAFTGNPEWMQSADKQLTYIARNIADYPSAYCFSLMALMQVVYPSRELIAVLSQDSQLVELRKLLAKHFLPDITVLVKTKENQEQLLKLAEYTGAYHIKLADPAYYLCENHACRSPVQNLIELEELLINSRKSG
jgi:uncharacterized protein YyaL (SSP411 family)